MTPGSVVCRAVGLLRNDGRFSPDHPVGLTDPSDPGRGGFAFEGAVPIGEMTSGDLDFAGAVDSAAEHPGQGLVDAGAPDEAFPAFVGWVDWG